MRSARSATIVLAALLLLPTAPAHAIDGDDPTGLSLLHADLPLFGSETEDKWPRSFSDAANGDFGCTSRVGFGDWELRPVDSESADPSWLRVLNYGVFHC